MEDWVFGGGTQSALLTFQAASLSRLLCRAASVAQMVLALPVCVAGLQRTSRKPRRAMLLQCQFIKVGGSASPALAHLPDPEFMLVT